MPKYDGGTWHKVWEAIGVRGSRSILQGFQGATSWAFACLRRCAQNAPMKFLDPDTESAVRAFLARLPGEPKRNRETERLDDN
jgi:hypothetical protein